MSALCSATETAYYRINIVRLRAEAEEGRLPARRALRLAATLPRLVTEVLIGNSAALYLATATFTWLCLEQGLPWPAVWNAALLTPILFVFGEIIPKRLACASPGEYAMKLSTWAYAMRFILTPVAGPISRLVVWLRRLRGRYAPQPPTGRRAGIMAVFHSRAQAAGVSRYLRRVADRCMETAGSHAGGQALPLAGRHVLPAATPVRDALRHMTARNLSAIALLDENGLPDGRVASWRELWRRAAHWDRPVGWLAAMAPRLPAGLPLSRAREALRATREGVALAVDAEGRYAGLLTARGLAEAWLAPAGE